MTTETLRKMIEDSMGGFTQEQLQDGFRKVANPSNWKMPIDAEIDPKDRDVVARAVPFMTGGDVHFEELPSGRLRVTGPGYYNSVGA